jgi:hypothetical protein
MLHLLFPDITPAGGTFNSFGDALARISVGYHTLQNALKSEFTSDEKRARLSGYLIGSYLPRCLNLFALTVMADVIALAQELKEDAATQVAIQD